MLLLLMMQMVVVGTWDWDWRGGPLGTRAVWDWRRWMWMLRASVGVAVLEGGMGRRRRWSGRIGRVLRNRRGWTRGRSATVRSGSRMVGVVMRWRMVSLRRGRRRIVAWLGRGMALRRRIVASVGRLGGF